MGPLPLGQGNTTYHDFALNRLVPHQEHLNRMAPQLRGRLKASLQYLGRYQPVIVRPHPTARGKYEILDGHQRIAVIRELGYRTVQCAVWNVDDDEARLCLVTLNRLQGRDVPERRMLILQRLVHRFGVDTLSLLIPDGRSTLTSLEEVNPTAPSAVVTSVRTVTNPPPVILEFFLPEPAAMDVNRALDAARESAQRRLSRGNALTRVARLFLSRFAAAHV